VTAAPLFLSLSTVNPIQLALMVAEGHKLLLPKHFLISDTMLTQKAKDKLRLSAAWFAENVLRLRL
jgi:hypothetical protein